MKLFLISLLLAGVMVPATAFASSGDKGQSVVRTNPPAVTNEAPKQNMPPIVERKLSNGIPVYFALRNKVPLANVLVMFPGVGAKNDPASKYGLSEFMATCWDSGCGQRDSLEFAEAVDLLGASISASNSWDNMIVSSSFVNSRADKVLDLMADMVLEPRFDDKEIERLKKTMLVSFINARTSPNSLAATAFNRYVFGDDSRYGTLRSGTPEQLKSINRQDMVDYYRASITPDRAIIVVSGDVEPDKMVELLNKRFGTWKRSSDVSKKTEKSKAVPLPEVEERFVGATSMPVRDPINNNIYIVNRPGSAQSVIRVGCQGISIHDPNRFAVEAMNTVLGDSFGSRLNSNLREKNGFTYGAHSGFDYREDIGAFAVSTSVQTDKTVPALKEILSELNGIRRVIAEDELQRAINYKVYTYPSNFETSADLAVAIASVKLHNLPDDYIEQYVPNFLKITPKDCKREAMRLIDVKRMKVIIVGDAKSIGEQLEKVGLRAHVLEVDEVMGPKIEP